MLKITIKENNDNQYDDAIDILCRTYENQDNAFWIDPNHNSKLACTSEILVKPHTNLTSQSFTSELPRGGITAFIDFLTTICEQDFNVTVSLEYSACNIPNANLASKNFLIRELLHKSNKLTNNIDILSDY